MRHCEKTEFLKQSKTFSGLIAAPEYCAFLFAMTEKPLLCR
jgi:hypothetical protein